MILEVQFTDPKTGEEVKLSLPNDSLVEELESRNLSMDDIDLEYGFVPEDAGEQELLRGDLRFVFHLDYEYDASDLDNFAEELNPQGRLGSFSELAILAFLSDEDGLDVIGGFKKYRDSLDEVIFYPDTTLEDIANELVSEELSAVQNKHMKNLLIEYFDYDKLIRDLEKDGYTPVDVGVFVRG